MNYLTRAVNAALRRSLGIEINRAKKRSIAVQHVAQNGRWTAADETFKRRQYSTYEEYAQHQVSKLETLDLSSYDVEYREVLRDRLATLNLLNRGDNVLCIAARIGTECKAFIDLGCFAVGIDLNPGEDNHYVVHGDFHHLQFADRSVDYVFTNALDHAFDLEKILAEIHRVLKPGGRFIAEIVGGSGDEFGRAPGAYESLWWAKVDDVVERIANSGFEIQRRARFSLPWEGEQFVFINKTQ